ncbi:hypothetical protein [Tengunoibacter tsumagoiensis]|uniref:Uncharacterized protein n=1 Tax=Tengunoibacter tsumagoiensis TaxID=2014871 RepID=A0A402A7V8_9CHLR|nr:hypothetical protein [Tengunoibacter tsumagoiensis]GCE15086.1 hypothetical protein KTT_49450 [Tengunoibacter tsumagoiensis]
MVGRKISRVSPDAVQLPLDFDQAPEKTVGVPKVIIPIGTTFEPGLGIRQALVNWEANNHQMIDIVFNGHHLELAEKYASNKKYDFTEQYIVGEGGLVNLSVFINILRCEERLRTWSKEVQQQTGTRAIRGISFDCPDENSSVGLLWKNLGSFPYSKKSDVSLFQSRYITPICWINKVTKKQVFEDLSKWTGYITYRIGNEFKIDLDLFLKEVTETLLTHKLAQGYICLSIWKSGQVEVIWTSYEDTVERQGIIHNSLNDPVGTLNEIQSNEGIRHIYENLLQKYHGIFVSSYKGAQFTLNSDARYTVQSRSNYERSKFQPNSVLFTVHLFCPKPL